MSCPTLTGCQAATDGGSQGWDGSAWPYSGNLPGFTDGVSCSALNTCAAAGSYFTYTQVIGTLYAGYNAVDRQSFAAAESYSASGSSAQAPGSPALGNRPPVQTIVTRGSAVPGPSVEMAGHR